MVAVRARLADNIARAVAGSGSTYAFGHPGGEVVVLIDALEAAGVHFVLTHHENTAAFMASGVGEITGRPGVCVATLGPGATNMTTGVASAYLERAPVLAFTGDTACGAPPGTTHQRLDLTTLYTPITKRSVRIAPETALREIESAIAECLAERPGPVHLAVPADVAATDARPSEPAPSPHARPDRSGPSQPLEAARALLTRARRPAIVAGIGALHADAHAELTALAHGLACPVAVPPKAKGLLSEDDPLFVGVLEMAGDDLVVEFLEDADLLLAVGLDVVELDKPWRFTAPVLHIDALPNEERYYIAELELVGPIPALLSALSGGSGPSAWTDAELAEHRHRLHSFVRPDHRRLQPWEIVDAARRALPSDTVATSDVGAHKMLVGQTWQTYRAKTFFMANGLSSMGYGLPVAMAACLVRPGRRPVAFVGDGGLGMYLGELETVVRLGLDILVIVFVDDRLELIRRSQVRRGVLPLGTSFENPDFEMLARSFGATGYRVSTSRQLESALRQALDSPGLQLIAAEIDGDDYRI